MRHLLLLSALLLGLPGIAIACTLHVEENPTWASASLRLLSSGNTPCVISEDEYRRVVSTWLQQRPADAPALTSLSLGRAVDYPWISRHLADRGLNDPAWRKQVMRASASQHNRFVAAVLSEPDFRQRLDAPFVGSSLTVQGVSVEKVLLGPASQYTSATASARIRVPFDAQVWLRLTPR